MAAFSEKDLLRILNAADLNAAIGAITESAPFKISEAYQNDFVLAYVEDLVTRIREYDDIKNLLDLIPLGDLFKNFTQSLPSPSYIMNTARLQGEYRPGTDITQSTYLDDIIETFLKLVEYVKNLTGLDELPDVETYSQFENYDEDEPEEGEEVNLTLAEAYNLLVEEYEILETRWESMKECLHSRTMLYRSYLKEHYMKYGENYPHIASRLSGWVSGLEDFKINCLD